MADEKGKGKENDKVPGELVLVDYPNLWKGLQMYPEYEFRHLLRPSHTFTMTMKKEFDKFVTLFLDTPSGVLQAVQGSPSDEGAIDAQGTVFYKIQVRLLSLLNMFFLLTLLCRSENW